MKLPKEVEDRFDEKFWYIGGDGVQCDFITLRNLKQFLAEELERVKK
jgi:hypothetical protein